MPGRRSTVLAATSAALLGLALTAPASSAAAAATDRPGADRHVVGRDAVADGLRARPDLRPVRPTAALTTPGELGGCRVEVGRPDVAPRRVEIALRSTRSVVFRVGVRDTCGLVGGLYATSWNTATQVLYADGWLTWDPAPSADGLWYASGRLTPSAAFLRNADAGQYDWDVVATGWDEAPMTDYVAGPRYTLRHWTRLTTQAAPAGGATTLRGRLEQADWERLAYAPYGGQPVQLQARSRTAGPFTTVARLTTDAAGRVAQTFVPQRDTCYRFVFTGRVTAGAAAAPTVCLPAR